jgi:hypothetical protein
MSNYTKEDLEGKVKKELVGIAKDLNLSTSGNRTDLINRIFEHKPSFGEMLSSAPVSKDGDLSISIEEEDVPVGVEVNDAYPDEEPKAGGATAEELSHAEPEAEVEAEAEVEKATVITAPPIEVAETAKTPETPEGMVSENTAEDILKGWQGTIQGFYRKNVPGVAPSRPAAPAVIAGQLGVPEAVGVLAGWQASIVSRLRPVRGLAPAPPKTAKDMVQVIKSL